MNAAIRPWYQWDWLTWFLSVIVISGLIARESEKRLVFGMTNLGILSEWSDLGWPLAHLQTAESREYLIPSSYEPSYESEWRPARLVANLLFCALLVVSTAFVSERWIQSRRRMQFAVQDLLAAMTVIGILIALTREWEVPYRDFDFDAFRIHWSLVRWSDFARPMYWPSLLGLVCLLYSAVWIAACAAERLYRLFTGSGRQSLRSTGMR